MFYPLYSGSVCFSLFLSVIVIFCNFWLFPFFSVFFSLFLSITVCNRICFWNFLGFLCFLDFFLFHSFFFFFCVFDDSENPCISMLCVSCCCYSSKVYTSHIKHVHPFGSLTVEYIFNQLLKKACGRIQETQLAASLKLISEWNKNKSVRMLLVQKKFQK